MMGKRKTREEQIAALQGRETSLRDVIMDSANGVLVTDAEGCVLLANPAAERILGRHKGELIGANFEIPLSPGGHAPVEIDVTKPDGSIIPVEFWASDTHWLGQPAFCISLRDLTERRNAETALRQERDFNNRLINTAQAIVLVLDGDGRVVSFNPYMEKLCGVPLTEARGKNWFDTFLPARTREKTHALFQSAIGGMATYGNVDVLLTHDGEERLIQWYDSTLRDENGRTTELLAIGHDVTARILAENEREEANTRLAAALKAADVGLWDYYPKENRAHYSDEWKRQLGYEPDEITESPEEWSRRLHRDDRDQAVKILGDYVQNGSQDEYSVEFRLRHKDGSYRWMLSRGAAVEREAGVVTRMLGCHVDITERKQAEERIEWLSRFPSENPNPVLRLSGNGAVQYANQASGALLSFLTVPGAGRLSPEWQKRVAACLDNDRVETQEINTDDRVFRATLTPVIKHGYVNVYANDVTELLKIEGQLRQAQKLESIGQLAGGVAHDFNNLLMGIMNYIGLCRDELEPEHPIRQWLDEMANDVKRSANLTRQLLAFARKQTITPKVLDLNDTVAGMLKLLRRLIGEDIELSWIPGVDLWPVKLDPSQIDQILANLCVNARDAIGRSGRVTIETRNVVIDEAYCASHLEAQSGPHVALEVSDTGHGMDRETIERIFEPFFTTKEVGKGTGLGLSTVHGIVRQNGGHINVYSKSGRGTTFRIYLPRFEGEKVKQSNPFDTSTLPCGGTETILVVEDEKSIRVTIRMFLLALGYTVLTAAAPDEALHLMEENSDDIDLLITDVIMPGMTGRDLADCLRKDYPNIKCLFMSGYTADVIAHSGVLDDDLDFLPKPFGRSQLAVKVREILERDRTDAPRGP